MMAERRALAGRADRHQAVGPLCDLPVHERAEGGLVQGTVLERRDERREGTSEALLGGSHGDPRKMAVRVALIWARGGGRKAPQSVARRILCGFSTQFGRKPQLLQAPHRGSFRRSRGPSLNETHNNYVVRQRCAFGYF